MKNTITFILLLLSIGLWGYLPTVHLFKHWGQISFFLCLISYIQVYHKDNLLFKNAIILFFIGTIFNIFSAYFNNGQNMRYTFQAFGSFHILLLYFLLHYIETEKKYLERFILIFGIIFTVLFFIQRSAFPNILFSGNIIYDNARNTVRIRMMGAGFCNLAFYMQLNKFLLKRKIFDIGLALLFFTVLFVNGYRTLIASTVLVSGFMFLKMVKYSPMNYLMIVVAVVGLIGFLQIGSNAKLLESMINLTQSQQEQGDDYIRAIALNYFKHVYPRNFSYYLFGGGLPVGIGSYGAYMRHLEQDLGIWWVDIGVVGFYFVVGGVTLLGMAWYSIKSLFIKLPKESKYLGFFFAYLILTTITTAEIYSGGMMVVQAVALYLIDVSAAEKEEEDADVEVANNP